jgi:hypothetical protein
MTSIDPYADWDASYVTGSLGASERLEYERHLAECPACAAAVAELAGLPGLLAKVPAAQVAELLENPQPIPMPTTLLPRLVRSARRRQRRTRRLIAGGILAVAAAAAAIVLVVPLVFSAPSTPSAAVGTAQLVSLDQVVTSPITASVSLTPERWGTNIKMDCKYAAAAATGAPDYAPGKSLEYELYVTDVSGVARRVASWTATPGSAVEPWGSTNLSIADIRSVDVRTMSGTVLLRGHP